MPQDDLNQKQFIVGLDIGTTKICVIAAEVTNNDKIRIIGTGHAVSNGMNKGVITNVSAAVKSIRQAIEECELKSGLKIDTVYTGIAGHHIQGINSEGVVAVNGAVVTQSDIDRVIESARAFNAPDKEILHTLSQEYIVDGQDGVKDPIGMSGRRLQAKVHIVLGAITSATNIVRCCNEAGLNVAGIVLEPLASSLAVLDNEEKELGVILLDIGGGTTDMVIYKNGSIVHTSVLPLGGTQVTNDIAIGLRTPRTEAINIKHEHGVALITKVDDGDIIKIHGISDREDRSIDKQILAEIIELRFREIFELVNKEISQFMNQDENMNYFGPITGLVITGGSSLLKYTDLLAEDVFSIPVRIGTPKNLNGDDLIKSPIYSTAAGLVLYGMEANKQNPQVCLKKTNPEKIFSNVFYNLKELIKDFF